MNIGTGIILKRKKDALSRPQGPCKCNTMEGKIEEEQHEGKEGDLKNRRDTKTLQLLLTSQVEALVGSRD